MSHANLSPPAEDLERPGEAGSLIERPKAAVALLKLFWKEFDSAVFPPDRAPAIPSSDQKAAIASRAWSALKGYAQREPTEYDQANQHANSLWQVRHGDASYMYSILMFAHCAGVCQT